MSTVYHVSFWNKRKATHILVAEFVSNESATSEAKRLNEQYDSNRYSVIEEYSGKCLNCDGIGTIEDPLWGEPGKVCHICEGGGYV